MKTSTVIPSFYYGFNISLYSIPSFIGNLWRVLAFEVGNSCEQVRTKTPIKCTVLDTGYCDWLVVLLSLPITLEHKRRSCKRNRKKWKSIELLTPLLNDSDFLFSLVYVTLVLAASTPSLVKTRAIRKQTPANTRCLRFHKDIYEQEI